jgi:hypothetical protein
MGFAEEYAKRIKTPTIDVTITTYPSGVRPSVDAPWYGSEYEYSPEVISCDINFGYDQTNTSCTLRISPDIIFSPMDKIVVKQGWNGENLITFFGFVDTVTLSDFPRIQTLECRDILKLAQNNYYVHSNRKGYHIVEFDDDGETFGGQPEEDRFADTIMGVFLEESGIPATRHNLEEINYYIDSTPIHLVIGNHKQWVVEYCSAMDAINDICELTHYRMWSTPDGMVQLGVDRPFATDVAAFNYYRGITGSGALINLSCSSSDESLRNWVDVNGLRYPGEVSTTTLNSATWNGVKYTGDTTTPADLFTDISAYLTIVWVLRGSTWLWYDPLDLPGNTLDVIYYGETLKIKVNTVCDFSFASLDGYVQIAHTSQADSDYVPDPPAYRRVEVDSELIDIPEMAQWMADLVLADLNRISYTGRATIEGDPRLNIGMTLAFFDEYTTIIGGSEGLRFFLYDYSSHQDASSYTMDLNLTGGVGIGAPAAGNKNPIASYYYGISKDGSNTIINCNASSSYDPDGSIVSYLWTCSGYADRTTVTTSYTYSGLIGNITPTLLVTDNDALTASITQYIVFSGA